MFSLIDALRNGVPSVWMPAAALICLLVYALWHRWRYRLSIAEDIETTTDQPEFLKPSPERRERIIKAGKALDDTPDKSDSGSFNWVILALAVVLIVATAWGVFKYSDAVSAVKADEATLDNKGIEAREKACIKYPGLC